MDYLSRMFPFNSKPKKRRDPPIDGKIYKCTVQHRETGVIHEAFLKRINGFWISDSGLKVEQFFNIKKWKLV